MEIVPGKTFRIGDEEAVCLPREAGFGIGTDVEIVREGEEIVIRRRRQRTGKDLADALRALPTPKTRLERQPIDWPDRSGAPRA